MTAYAFYVIRCNGCGYDYDTASERLAAARRSAKEDGWTRPRAHPETVLRIDLCPACSEEATR